MKKSIIKLTKFITSFFLILLLFTVEVNSQSKKKILYISSGSVAYSSTQNQIEGFTDAIRNNHEIYFEHMNTIKERNIETIDMVIVNLYPFFEKVREDLSF